MPWLIYIALDPKCFLHFWPHAPPSPRASLLPWQLLCMTVSCMSCHRQWYFPRLCGALHHSRLVGWHAHSYKQLAYCDQWDNVGLKWATYLIVTCCHLKGENVSSCILQRKAVGYVPGSVTLDTVHISDVDGGKEQLQRIKQSALTSASYYRE